MESARRRRLAIASRVGATKSLGRGRGQGRLARDKKTRRAQGQSSYKGETCSRDNPQSNNIVQLPTPHNNKSYKMFSRVAAFTALALPLLAAATSMKARTESSSSLCSTGSAAQCCESTEPVSIIPSTRTVYLLDSQMSRPTPPPDLRSWACSASSFRTSMLSSVSTVPPSPSSVLVPRVPALAPLFAARIIRL